MLHNRRKRLEQLAVEEASGKSFWSDSFDASARRKIVLIVRRLIEGRRRGEGYLRFARNAILLDEGLFYLVGEYESEADDMLHYIMRAENSMMPTVIEALSAAFHNDQLRYENDFDRGGVIFAAMVAGILREHRISFELVNGEMVEFSSRALHVGVVSPALMLLAGDSKWAGVEKAFRNALTEISDGKPDDAITDAGTALQETLTILGCAGNALGPLIKSARNKGILASHDGPMLDAIDKLLNWVSADRSQSGDAHSASEATVDDAWLIVHVVGAVILRLSKGIDR